MCELERESEVKVKVGPGTNLDFGKKKILDNFISILFMGFLRVKELYSVFQSKAYKYSVFAILSF